MGLGEERLPEPPSFYYHRQIYSCFFKDTAGMKLLDEVGVDNVLFETDYPHSDGTFRIRVRLLIDSSGTSTKRSSTNWLGVTPSSCSTFPSTEVPRLLVVCHSPGTALPAMVEAAVTGSRSDGLEGVDVVTIAALELTTADVLGADGYLLVTLRTSGTWAS